MAKLNSRQERRTKKTHMNAELNIQELISIAKDAAVKAGEAVMQVYESADGPGAVAKSDNSPLTLADMASHRAIMEILADTKIPVLSEEGSKIPFEERSAWEQFWLVDPLDGTKEFINRNGEFTVNIALVNKGKVEFGVVYVPVKNQLFWGGTNWGAYSRHNNEEAQPIHCKTEANGTMVIVASRSHSNEETRNFIERYPDHTLQSVGSSLKLLQVAEGTAHIYPRFGPTMEWDTCAAQGVVEGAGGFVITTTDSSPLQYNKENLLNPFFIVCGSMDFLNNHA